jgi:NADPH:quinone reductase-like Zn-dependent oxidoreductase
LAPVSTAWTHVVSNTFCQASLRLALLFSFIQEIIMKTIRAYQYGNPDVLQLEEVDDLTADTGQVLIEVAGSGINPIDWKILSGAKKQFIPVQMPYTPGVEVSGKVIGLGKDVNTLAIGDEVFGLIGIVGGYATQAAVYADRLAIKPKRLSLLEAAGVPAAALTAWQALHEHARIQAGQRILIHGAAGGVGSMAVQMARIAGADIIATASAGNHDYLYSLGARHLIDYRNEAFERLISKVDIVLDLVGGETQARSWSVLKKGGVLVSPVSSPSQEAAEAVGATGKNFAARPDGKQLQEVAALFEAGELKVETEVLPLSLAAHALQKSLAGHTRGKIVLDTRH